MDEVLATVFRAPAPTRAKTRWNSSCHGSSYVVAEILRLLHAAGARTAEPGEFTARAFLAGKMDLAQAEAVADLIASSSRASHALATAQMRGGFSDDLHALRDRLLHLASLLELELDFSEEDVEFADRTQLRGVMEEIGAELDTLCRSFSLGNALKQGRGRGDRRRTQCRQVHAAEPASGRGTRHGFRHRRHHARRHRGDPGHRRRALPASSTPQACAAPTTGWNAWASNGPLPPRPAHGSYSA